MGSGDGRRPQADAESPDASRAGSPAPAAALRNADGPSGAGLVVADFALLRDRFPVGDSDAVRVFAVALLFVPAIRPGDVAAAAEDGAPSDAGPDSAPSAAAVPGLAAIAKPTRRQNNADPTREPKFAEFTLPPWSSNTPMTLLQHDLTAGAQPWMPLSPAELAQQQADHNTLA